MVRTLSEGELDILLTGSAIYSSYCFRRMRHKDLWFGYANLVQDLVKTGVQGMLPSDVCVQDCNSHLHGRKLLDKELVVANGSFEMMVNICPWLLEFRILGHCC